MIDRKKWENYWYYYKIHTFAGLFALIVLVVTIKDCAQRVEPDVTLGYMGGGLTAEQVEKFAQACSERVQDVDGDGKNIVLVRPLSIPQQIVALMASGEMQLFAFDRETFLNFARGGAFQPLDDIVPASQRAAFLKRYPEIRLQEEGSSEEFVYGIPLEGSPVLEELGIRLEGRYLGLRVPKKLDDPREALAYENAYAILEMLL